ncbi:MAG: FGGY-family carbohydrate kinase [Christensenellaceae bacterium]|jgi:xylulokinase|nr:FGGY-family carbohydrate kinase [Christensenellaceae bacterium]
MYVLAHDMGTSSDKAILADFNGKIIATARASYPTYYPNPAWVEQIPSDYWEAVVSATKKILEKTGISPNEIKAIVFTTQSMGLIPVDIDGKTLYNNITWVDGRAQKQADSIMKRLGGKKIFTLLSGTPIMGKDVIAKIIWIKEERPEIYKATKYFLDVNGYLKYKCTGRMVSELSGASSYGLDLKKKKFLSVLSLTGLDMKKLPPLVKSTDQVGTLTIDAANELGLNQSTIVFGGCDDVQSACIGSGMNDYNNIHIYLGTSAWVCVTTKDETRFKNGAAAIQSGDPEDNLVVGVTEAAGSNIEWLLNRFFSDEKENLGDGIYRYLDKCIEKVPAGSDNLIFTPWMLGERCPVSDTTARATLFNINEEHTREHMLRAVYEGVGYNLKWIFENFEKDYKIRGNCFRVIGGGALNAAWIQIISDITGIELDVLDEPRDIGALGGAIIALIGLGHYTFSDTSKFTKVAKTYIPNKENSEIYNKLFMSYKDVYYGLKEAYEKANGKRFTNK